MDKNNLIPDKSRYANWLTGFKTPPSIWKRLLGIDQEPMPTKT
jgi:hypothetical protein